jgi:TRAP-type C4-dicarboxylate transport system permease large subunit
MLRIWPLLLLIGAVLGTLFAGVATPTEAAGAGVAAALLVGFLFGSLTLGKLGEALMSTVKTFAVIAVVFMGAIILAQSISVLGLPQQLLRTVADLGIPPLAMLALVVLIYLGLGCLFDGLSMMIMTLPVVFPLLTGLGYDPIWLGVIVTIMIEVGMLTPPVGMNLFVLVGISGNRISLSETARAALPYWFALIVLVAILVVVPSLATGLPDLVMGTR